MNWIYDNWISIFSLIIASASFIYSWYCNKMNLDVNIDNATLLNTEDAQQLLINCTINNNSRNNINVNSAYITIDKKYNAVKSKIYLGSVSSKIFNQEVIEETYSIQLPLKLYSYDSITSCLVISLPFDLKIPNTLQLVLNTSRGIKKLTFNKIDTK